MKARNMQKYDYCISWPGDYTNTNDTYAYVNDPEEAMFCLKEQAQAYGFAVLTAIEYDESGSHSRPICVMFR